MRQPLQGKVLVNARGTRTFTNRSSAMRIAAAVLVLATVVSGGAPGWAVDERALEAYAWSEDRDAALARFAPGSDDHWYYRCLRLQQQGKLPEADALISEWAAQRGQRHERLAAMRLRQAALWFDRDPATGW